jgi:hypothetical protein
MRASASRSGAYRGAYVRPRAGLAIVLIVGLGVGAATSILQARLSSPWLSLVNAASPWLAPAFVVGTMWRRPRAAASAGLLTCLLELGGYSVTAAVRGYTSSHTELLFWGAAAVVGGPIFGVAGWLWWRGSRGLPRVRGVGASVLAAAFFAEAIVSFGWRLHYWSSAVLFGVLGVVAIALLGFHRRQHARIARWLVVTLPIGIVGELALGLLYRQAF